MSEEQKRSGNYRLGGNSKQQKIDEIRNESPSCGPKWPVFFVKNCRLTVVIAY